MTTEEIKIAIKNKMDLYPTVNKNGFTDKDNENICFGLWLALQIIEKAEE